MKASNHHDILELQPDDLMNQAEAEKSLQEFETAEGPFVAS